ncbi:hypothetical protein ACFQVA_33940 [Actinomadura keratinilytica]
MRDLRFRERAAGTGGERVARAEAGAATARRRARLPARRGVPPGRRRPGGGPRPRGAASPGLYNVCYVNAFQAQPGARGWPEELLLRDPAGAR